MTIVRTLLAVLVLAAPAHAEVLRIEVTSRADVLSGKAFGAAGPFERLSGRIYFAVDPRNPVNQIIADIDKAPKNAAGLVEFSSDFYLIKPKDAARGNGTLLYEVSNRGGKGMVGFFNFASGSVDPQTRPAIAWLSASLPSCISKRVPTSNRRTRSCWRRRLPRRASISPGHREIRISASSAEIGFASASVSRLGNSNRCIRASTKL